MKNEIIFEQIKSFISEKWEIDKDTLSRETSLLKDLNIYGDDTTELISLFAKKFNIPIQNIDLSRYNIGDESFSIAPLIRFIKGENVELKPTITLAELEQAVYEGKLK